MSNRKCCVPGCVSLKTQVNLHKFPNPAKNKELFNTWVYLIGGDILQLENDNIFKYRRVCHVHFEQKYWCRNYRLTKDAVPMINMPGLSSLKFYSKRSPLRSLQMSEASTSKEPVAPHLQTLSEDVLMKENLEPVTSFMDSVAGQIHNLSAEEDIQIKENLDQHKMPRAKIVTKKWLKLHAVSQSEDALYKKLISVGVKLSKCRSKVQKQANKIKALQNITTNPQFLKTLDNFSSIRKY